MKKYFLMTMLLAFLATTLSAQTGYEMVIEKIDGTKIRINTSEVKHSYFQKLEIDASNAVDLGLPSGKKWANMNIGANTETDFGTYFAWGETTGYTVLGHNNLPADGNTKTEFSWSTYKWCDGTSDVFTKYVPEGYYNNVDYKTVLERSDDAAFANWGAPWRMPTKEEFEELLANTTTEFVSNYNNTGVNGYKLTGSNGNYIFLPAAAYINERGMNDGYSNSESGYYWSSTISESRIVDADNLCFSLWSIYVGYAYYRYSGMPVRAIWDDNNNTGTDAKEKLAGTWEITSCDDPDTPVGMTFTFNENGTGVCTYQWYSDTFNYTFDSNGNFTKKNADGTTSTGHLDIVNNVARGYFTYSGSTKQYSITLTMQSGNTTDNYINGIYYSFDSNNMTAEVIAGENQYTSSVTIPSTVEYKNATYTVTEIHEMAFYDNRGLTSITFPTTLKKIGEEAFRNCSNLTEITLPNSLTTIEDGAFRDCVALTTVNVGTGIETIKKKAFGDCYNLKDFYCNATTPPTLRDNVFQYSSYNTATLHVPNAETYRNANSQWAAFGNVVSVGGATTDAKEKLAGTWTLTSCDDPDTPVGMTFTFNSNGTGVCTYQWYSDTFNYTFDSEGTFTKVNADGTTSGGHLDIVNNVASGYFTYSGSTRQYSITLTKQSGNDNPEPASTGTYQGAKRVFGNVLLSSIYNETDDITEAWTYDGNGYPTKITSTSSSRTMNIIPSYGDGQIIYKSYIGSTLTGQYVVTIGSNGYASKVELVDDKGNPETVYLTYNSNEQLSTIQWGSDDTWQFTYSDDDVVSINDNGTIYTINYETSVGEKMLNTGCFLLWDEMLPVDVDDLQSLHFAGLLGKATKHLPMSYIKDSNGSYTRYYTNNYETDSNGRVTKFTYTTKYVYNNGGEDTDNHDILRISWNGDDQGCGNSGISGNNPIIGVWEIVSGTYKRYENNELVKDDVQSLTSPYDRVEFFADGTFKYYVYSHSTDSYREDGTASYSMDGTAFVYGNGDWDYFELESYNGTDQMEVLFQTLAYKDGTTIRRVFRDKLQRVTDTPSLESSLQGTWYTIWSSTDLTEIQGYAFNSDGTATGFEGKLRQSDNYSPTHAEQYNCRYTLSGNTLTIRDVDTTDIYTISLNNDGTITLLDSRGRADVYTRLPEDKTPLQFYQEMAESLQSQ